METWSESETVPTPDFLREVTAVDSNPLLQLSSQSPSISHNESQNEEGRAAKRPCLRPSANPVESVQVGFKAKFVQKGKGRKGVLMTDFFRPKPPETNVPMAQPASKDDMYDDDSPDSPIARRLAEQDDMLSPLAFTQQAAEGHC